MSPDSNSSSDDDSTALAGQIGRLADGAVPLAEGLRAVASESDSRSLTRGLRQLAAALEQGQSLDAALGATAPGMSPDVRGLIAAAQRTGNLAGVLAQWIDNRRSARRHWRQVLAALTYPLLTAAAAFGVFLFMCWAVVPPMRRMLVEFGLTLPAVTRSVFWLSEYGAQLMCAMIVVLCVLAVGLRLLGGAAVWSRAVTALPVIGDLWHWSSVSEMLRGLQLLLENQVPLPEALQLVGESTSDRYIGRNCREFARRVGEGQSFGAAIDQAGGLPRSLLPLIAAGERQAALAGSLGIAAQMLEARLRTLSQLVATLGPPLIFLWIAVVIGGMYVGLYTPTISLIQGLS